MKIDRKEVLHIAELSRLTFTEEELDAMGEQMGSVLEKFRRLDEVDVSDVPPTAHILPFVDGSAYIVPKVLE